ncbi:VOC family protein [Streptomyces sp. NPDC005438]|uniref:VOC family protein n=1 Tax=Streptomyces sp. NPDC005438 TaxID=3156880 RepID=UPI0033B6D0D3
MIRGIDHVGVAVESPAVVGEVLAALGLTLGHVGEAQDYGVHCRFWNAPSSSGVVELVEPRHQDSVIQKHLDRQGPGIYHIAFEVDDLNEELSRLREVGMVPLDPEPRAGAKPGMRVAFLYPGHEAGFLVELVEYTSPDSTEPLPPQCV